ncbi:hypothetical protein [Corallococcus sp. CA041A]|uniref:hypothetical protein n=1 Tax=Corallococcus sp. CA041A TaxID=2316727 RepID=UPI0011C4687F|nr:hypothetical protein [Corallococcus sp. CA041A]
MKKFAFARHRVLCFAGAFLLSLSCGPQEGLTPDLDETGEVSQAALAAPTLLEVVPGNGR